MDSRYLKDKEELKQPAVDDDRRAFLTAGLVGGAVAAGALMTGAAHAQQVAQAPALSDKPWWPHPKWGKDDQAGASNYMTPAKTLDAVKLIKDGKVYRIGRVYESGMPKFGERAFTMRIPGAPTGGPFGANKLIYHDEYLATEIGQTGTQFDASAISASRWARTATRTRCVTTTASPNRTWRRPTASPSSASSM